MNALGTPAPSDALMAGARNLVSYVKPQPGQNTLIHTEPGYDDPLLLAAVRRALEDAGTSVSILHTPRWDKQHDPPPPVVVAALHGCDILLGQGEYLHTKNRYLQEAIFERGLVYINNEAKTVAALSSDYGRFPADLLFAIGTAVIHRLARGRHIRVTTRAGTDVSMGVATNTIGGYCYPFTYDTPGHKKGFPGGVVCFHPEAPVEGVIAVEGVTRRNKPPKSVLDKPLFLELSDHRVTKAWGAAADWWTAYAGRGDDNTGWLAECMWGVHPKATGVGGRAASNPNLLHFGLGNSIPYGGPAFSKSWQVMFVEEATVTVDGDELVVDGHLTALDDREVRAVAATFGDPDELLTQVPAALADHFAAR